MMTIQASPLIPRGTAVLKRGQGVVAIGSIADVCANYQKGLVLVVSPDTDEALRAKFAKDVTPKAALPTDRSS